MSRHKGKWDILYKEVIKKAKEFRKNRGISQKKIADDIGISQTVISRFETCEIDSIYILLYYISIGFNIKSILEVYKNENNEG